jgi:hypothetical protein
MPFFIFSQLTIIFVVTTDARVIQWRRGVALPIPDYVSPFESTMRTFITLAALVLIWAGASRMQGRASSRYATAGLLSAALIAWIVLAQRLGAANTNLATTDSQPPGLGLPLALLLPLALAAGGIWASRQVTRLIFAIPLWSLVAIQTYRIAGGIFLLLWASGRLPWQFALPAGIGDVVTGCSAVVVAALLARKADNAPRAAYLWCLFGIADLAVAVPMGLLTSPGRLHLLALTAPNQLVSAYPLVMIPTFGVPLALILHGIVLWRLRTSREESSIGSRPYAAQGA